jgi:S-(hydroxymethyl)glutathione dehydrogenase/alcohol dehydrogenase
MGEVQAVDRREEVKAAILYEIGKPLMIADINLPPLAIGQVLVRVHASGICGKQINEVDGNCGPDKYLPHLLGHEGAGVVEEIGEGVSRVLPGDSVVLHWRKGTGIEAKCPKYEWKYGLIGGGSVTTFNEYAIVSENRLTAIDPDIPFDVAVLMGCAVTTGLGVIFHDSGMEIGQRVAVIGCGGVGLNVIQGAHIHGAGEILAIDQSAAKEKLARYLGASEFSTNTENHAGACFDVVVDTTGVPANIVHAYEICGEGGKIIMVGQPRKGESLIIPNISDHFRGKMLMDTQGGSTNPNRDIPRYLGLYERGLLKLDELITHRFPLEQINDALDVVRHGEAGRVILEMK